jgi:hypothetical protein
MWNTFWQQWDYLVLNLIVGLYVMLGAALGLILIWLLFPVRLLKSFLNVIRISCALSSKV